MHYYGRHFEWQDPQSPDNVRGSGYARLSGYKCDTDNSESSCDAASVTEPKVEGLEEE